MRLVLDTEFNAFNGPLISMALVAEDGREWYEVLPCANPAPWVQANVLPKLGKPPVADRIVMTRSLARFLYQFPSVHVIADWPEDIRHFCDTLLLGPGQCISTPPLSFQIDRNMPATHEISAVPHNALEDARALARHVWGQKA